MHFGPRARFLITTNPSTIRSSTSGVDGNKCAARHFCADHLRSCDRGHKAQVKGTYKRTTLSNGCAWERMEVPDDEPLGQCGLLGKGVCIYAFGHMGVCVGQPCPGKRPSRAREISFAGMQGSPEQLVITHVVSIEEEDDDDSDTGDEREDSQRHEEEVDDDDAVDVLEDGSDLGSDDEEALVADLALMPAMAPSAPPAAQPAVLSSATVLPPAARDDAHGRVEADYEAFLDELSLDVRERARSLDAKNAERRADDALDGGGEDRRTCKRQHRDEQRAAPDAPAATLHRAQTDDCELRRLLEAKIRTLQAELADVRQEAERDAAKAKRDAADAVESVKRQAAAEMALLKRSLKAMIDGPY